MKERDEKLYELTKMKVIETLFDGDIHKWNINNSEFGNRLKGHRNVCVVIEDRNNNVFGGYCSKEIGIDMFHFDFNSFVFSVKRNGRYKMRKYPIRKWHCDFKIFNDNHNVLFAFGAENNNNRNYIKDIIVFKKDTPHKSYCDQYSYDYQGERNALCDNLPKSFIVERIVVYELEESEKWKNDKEINL